jgi:hypothetical protein
MERNNTKIVCEKPDNYSIEYLSEGKWLPVCNVIKIPSLPIGNTVNTATFDMIATTQIRINFKNELP